MDPLSTTSSETNIPTNIPTVSPCHDTAIIDCGNNNTDLTQYTSELITVNNELETDRCHSQLNGEKENNECKSNNEILQKSSSIDGEDEEAFTNKPLLDKATSVDEDTQTSKEGTSNSRSGSTSVRFDGIILDVLNSTTIHVEWYPITNNDTVYGYKIRYAARDNSSYNEIFVTPGICSYTITGLRPNTEYDISVNAVDDRDSIIQTCGWVRQKTDELEDGQAKQYETPYLTAAAAIALLLVAVVVPVTFLFVRNCGQCDSSNQTDKPSIGHNQNELGDEYMQGSFRHRKRYTEKGMSSSDSQKLKLTLRESNPLSELLKKI